MYRIFMVFVFGVLNEFWAAFDRCVNLHLVAYDPIIYKF